MPEGDSIYQLAARLRPLLGGCALTGAYGREQGPLPQARGERVESIETRGKHLLIHLSGGFTFHVHLGIGGRCRHYPRTASDEPRAYGAATLALVTKEVRVLFYRTRFARLLRTAHVRAEPGLRSLGPDLMADEVDLDAVIARARSLSPPARAVGEVLSDQRIAAGIGNVLRCETLFLARLSPWQPLGAIDDAALGAVYELARRLLRAGREGRRQTVPRQHRASPRASRFWVYRRTGYRCLACGTPIRSRRQGDKARTTYFCPRCQEAPP